MLVLLGFTLNIIADEKQDKYKAQALFLYYLAVYGVFACFFIIGGLEKDGLRVKIVPVLGLLIMGRAGFEPA